MNIAASLSTDCWRHIASTYAYKCSNKEWKPYKHLMYPLDYVWQEVIKGGARIIINMPAQYGKSLTFSKWLALCYLEHYPMHQVIHSSYEKNISTHYSRLVRDEADNNPLINITISKDNRPANDWFISMPDINGILKDAGGMKSSGIGSAISGRGGNLLILDDPVKNWVEALSKVISERNINWFNSTFRKRMRHNASIIVVCTRWSKKDLAEYLLKHDKQDKWIQIKLKEKAEKDDPLQRNIGECLCKHLFSQKEVDKKDDGTIIWTSMGQQEPSNIEGAIFKKDDFKYWTHLPEQFDDTIISLDANFGESIENLANSQISLQYIGRKASNKYLIDRINTNVEFYDSIPLFVSFLRKHNRVKRFLIEGKANGAAIISVLKKSIPGIDKWMPQGKLVQALGTQPCIKSGNFYIPADNARYKCADGTMLQDFRWVSKYTDQMCDFPQGDHDDDVDATCQASLRLDELADYGETLIGWG